MKFVFVNPGRSIVSENIWSAVNSVTLPIGLATLAAVIENAGISADVVDANALGLTPEETVERIDPEADFVGFTATTPEINIIIRISALVRDRLPGARIVFGGVHPTVRDEELVSAGFCDMVVRGEGEEAVLALVNGSPLSDVPNLTWKDDSAKVVRNPQSDGFVDLEALPYPAYDKLPMQRYRSALGAARQSQQAGLITSRGCPGKCTFCFSGMFGSRIRMESAQKIYEHILYLRKNYGIREISFYDDTFTASRKRVTEFCNLLIDNRVKISWSCFARVDSVRPDLLRLMKRAGCHQIMFGLESPDEEILKNINKRVTVDKALDAMSWTREAGIDIRGAFMLGNPGETEATLQGTIDYAIALNIQFAIFNITTPFPGTALFDWAKEEGYLKHEDWDCYDLSHAVLALPTVSEEAVENSYNRAFRAFYFRIPYMIRRLFGMRSVYDVTTNLKAFLRVLATVFFPWLGRGR